MVELVNNHVLFPEPANWRQRPTWERRWQNTVSAAVTGAESRLGVRAEPRASIAVLITPASINEQVQLDDRIRAALKSGLACAPLAGRGYLLQADVNADTATLDRDWNAALGSYLFFQTAGGLYEVRQVTAAAGADITLDDNVDRTYAAGAYAWPLIFGKFSAEEIALRSPRLGPIKITIQEQVAPATAQIGEVVAPGGDGIGVWAIGTTFEIQ